MKTYDEIRAMTPEQKRLAIAKIQGWTDIKTNIWGYVGREPITRFPKHIPDYLRDLNAMHEVEASLCEEKLDRFRTNLEIIILSMPDPDFPKITAKIFYWHATAEQRADAFLMVML